ncbi:MAG: biotin synthase BioB, partial [Planctomycetota bacterium]
ATGPAMSTIEHLAENICAGAELDAATARALLDVDADGPAAAALFAAARRVRRHFRGDTVSFCSILNAKAGNCTENCSYCSQAAGADNQDYSKHKWLDEDEVRQAAASAAANGASALGLVAAWKGVKEGAQLEMVCESVRRLSREGSIRADVNLGILESQACADALRAAGASTYGHNLETARSFFEQTCDTHGFEQRLQTIRYIKQAGMGLCSGGIIGLGENKDQRIEFAEQLRYIEPDMIPINFLNPLAGTDLADRQPVPAGEALITLAVFRLFLPQANIMVAGGKEVTFGERLHEVLGTGINALMVGNYLTTLGTGPDYWQEHLPRYGLRPAQASGCGCGSGGCGSDTAAD